MPQQVLLSQQSLAPGALLAALRLIGSLVDLLPPRPPHTPGNRAPYPHDALFMELAESLVVSVSAPPPSLHSELGGVPILPTEGKAREAAMAYQQRAASTMEVLAGMLRLLPLPALHEDVPNDRARRQPRSGEAHAGTAPPEGPQAAGPHPMADSDTPHGTPPLIQELSDAEAEAEQLSERAQVLVLRLLLLAASFAPDSRLFTPWSSLLPETPSAASALLLALACRTCNRGTGGVATAASASASLALLSPHEVCLQGLLAAAAPLLLPQLRRALIAAQPHVRTADAAAAPIPQSPTGPNVVVATLATTFERAVAARSLACIVRSVKHPFIGPLVSCTPAQEVLGGRRPQRSGRCR